jgi:hypothetical protein
MERTFRACGAKPAAMWDVFSKAKNPPIASAQGLHACRAVRHPINMGGTWLGEGHTRIHALARELGLETYPQHVQGDNLIIVDGKVGRHTGTIPRVNPLA